MTDVTEIGTYRRLFDDKYAELDKILAGLPTAGFSGVCAGVWVAAGLRQTFRSTAWVWSEPVSTTANGARV